MSSAQRRINSTGRKKIKREDIRITMLTPSQGEPLAARVVLNTDDWKFPDEAKIVVEAYHRNSGMRFECGTVAAPSPPDTMELSDLDPSSSVLFRIKVVDGENGTGKMLGAAERIRPASDDDSDGRRSIFPIVLRDIGDEFWRVEIDDAGPVLILNLRVPGFQHRILENPMIAGTLLPAAFRTVLNELIKQPVGATDDEDSWQAEWLEFCSGELKSDDPSDLDSDEARTEWVDDMVARFCSEKSFVGDARKYIQGGH